MQNMDIIGRFNMCQHYFLLDSEGKGNCKYCGAEHKPPPILRYHRKNHFNFPESTLWTSGGYYLQGVINGIDDTLPGVDKMFFI